MKQFIPKLLLLLSTMTLAGVIGCDQAEQDANSTIEKTQPSDSQVIDEAIPSADKSIGLTGEGKPTDSSEKDNAENQEEDEATE